MEVKQQWINGRWLEYTDIGRGRPILFLHGILSDRRMWSTESLVKLNEFRCIALTMRGFGDESKATEDVNFSVDTHTQDLLEFCKQLQLSKVTLVAWSYSGHIALQAALEKSSFFKQVIIYELIVPSYGMSEAVRKTFARDMSRAMRPVKRALKQENLSEAIDEFTQMCSNGSVTLAKQSAKVKQMKVDNRLTLSYLLNQPPPKAITANQLATLSVPVHILWGGLSRDIFILPSKAAHAALGTRGKIDGEISGKDHLWPEEDNLSFIKVIKKIID